ncbi:MAG: virulence RhuM family protein [Candidatus Absconditabacteria bacterium]|nr:virulence RhuM family protein [Candidatus Absconditabacteria bacterium]
MTSNLIIYETQDGQTKIQVNLDKETVWLTQDQMSTLFNRDQSVLSRHIKKIYEEGELEEKSTMQKMHIAISDKPVAFYNLDVIISVGYRVKSQQGTQFRIRATERLKEYIVKGFTMDDDRLKQEGAKSRYFEELLQRVRDIRSSERNFYQKITDIYTTAIDYKRDDELTKQFFATVQNKIHYAIHGKTAAEVIKERVNSDKEFMGLTNFKGKYITTRDIGIAKNYLTENELRQLNLIVSMYLDFAELQAMNMQTMTMQNWINKLDDFLKTSGKELLDNSGSISHKEAIEKAKIEYEKYRKEEDKNYISDFDKEVQKLTKKK